MSLQQDFMQEIANTVFGKNLKDESTKEKRCFLHRFELDNKFKQNTEIAELIKRDMNDGYCIKTMARTLKNTIKALVDRYEAEINKDGIDSKIWINRDRGEKGSWPQVYDWLWNYKYPRWLEANSWQILQNKAKSIANWLNFKTTEEINAVAAGTKGPSLQLPPPAMKPTISANQHLWMTIDLDCPNYQLLLFNRSKDGKRLLCPSFGYAIDAAIQRSQLLLPQKDSWAGQTDQKFVFKDVGKEEFLAIVLEKYLDLPWLTPRREEALPELTAERIKQLFDKLEHQDNWQVFYQSFEVVEANKTVA